jgi:hypothetical protein
MDGSALRQVLLDSEDVPGQELLGGDEHTAVALGAHDHVVDGGLLEEGDELRQTRRVDDDRDVTAFAQVVHGFRELSTAVVGNGVEDVTMRDHAELCQPRGSLRRANRVDLRAGSLEIRNDPAELLQVVGDGEHPSSRQNSVILTNWRRA